MSHTYCHTHSKYDCPTCADEILSLGIQVDKDRIKWLESEVARLEACAAELATLRENAAMVDDLRKDAERYRYLRKQHWSEAEICVVTNPKDAIKLGCYCPSSVRLDSAIDAAMQERQP